MASPWLSYPSLKSQSTDNWLIAVAASYKVHTYNAYTTSSCFYFGPFLKFGEEVTSTVGKYNIDEEEVAHLLDMHGT